MKMIARAIVTILLVSTAIIHVELKSIHQSISNSLESLNQSATTNSPLSSDNDNINDNPNNMANNSNYNPHVSNIQQQIIVHDSNSNSSSIALHPRVERDTDTVLSAAGHCPVLPETGVIVDDNEYLSYFHFHWNDPKPAASEDQGLKCPESRWGSWWEQPHRKSNLRAACPWVYVFNPTATHLREEVYPKYVKSAKCVCPTCLLSSSVGCAALWTEKVFYNKIGCKGKHPVFQRKTKDVQVGCFCRK